MPLQELASTGQGFPLGEPDVQRTTFSIDVLGRFICSTYDEATTNPDFDVVIIGSGMYGAYCAAKIYTESGIQGRKPLRVLVLEAGPFLVYEHGQNIPDLGLSNPFRPGIDPFSADAMKTRDLVWGLGWRGDTGFPGTAYCVGGKSLYWGGWCPQLRESDLEQWPAEVRTYLTSPPAFGRNEPNRLEPPTRSSVYEQTEFEIGVKPADDYVFDPILGPDEPAGAIGLNAALEKRLFTALAKLRSTPAGTPLQDPEPPPIAVQAQSNVSGVFSPDKYSSLTLLISAIRSAQGSVTGNSSQERDGKRRLFLVPNAHVSRLIVPDVRRDGTIGPGYRVTQVDVVVDGALRHLPLKPTCTVILAQGCIESTRLALECFPTDPLRGQDELMGRNLMAHLRFDFPFQIDRQAFAQWVQTTTGKMLRDRLQTAAFHIQADTDDGRFHLQIYAAGIDTNPQGSDNPEGLLFRMIPDAEVAQQLADRQDPNEISLIFRACGEMRGNRTARVHDSGTNWIDLASDADRDQQFNHARAFVHYADQSGAAMWTHMRKACVALAQEMGAKATPAEDRHEVGSTWHDAGTLFMGDDPSSSVTDTSGHFHHIANVACVDQALFPTVGSANPVLTGLCLARKSAETIVSRYVSEVDLSATDITAEQAEGFIFLLDAGNFGKWRPNDPAFSATRPFLIENDSILEVHGDNGLGVLFYDDADPFGDGSGLPQDFELRLQWKAFLEPGTSDITANSGILLRTPLPGLQLDDDTFYSAAIEVQIDDTGYDATQRRFRSALHRTGAIYTHAPARAWAQKVPSADGEAGVWNEYRIRAHGSTVSVLLNGRLVSDGTVPASLNKPGYLGLQYHTGKIQFRAIRLGRL